MSEIVRVARRGAFIKVNGFRNIVEQKELEEWNLVAKTILSETEWEKLFLDLNSNMIMIFSDLLASLNKRERN